jgi:potassium/hydrogen antiporter
VLGVHRQPEHERDMRIFAATLADVVTVFVFLTVGANLPFSTMADQALPGLAVIAVLVLVARPITVLACAAPDRRARWTRAELAFLAWTRETGVVPAALVGVLAGLGVPGVDVLASVVAIAILTTLIAQALPAPWLARRLGLLDAEPG